MSRIRIRLLCGMGLTAVAVAAASAQTPPKPDAPAAKEGVAAYIGGEPVTLQELDAKALKTDMKLAQSLYNARRAALDQVLLDRLLGPEAATRKITVEQLVKEKAGATAKPIVDTDIETFYNANKARMGNQTLEQASPQIRGQLSSQREAEARGIILKELKDKAGVKVTMDPPRADIVIAANDPTKGPATAKVTIVEYSEFQ